MASGARLEADGLDPFDLTDANGFDVAVLDLGFPAIRTSSSARADADGEDDRTKLFGARAVVLSGTVIPTATSTRQQVLDRLRSFLNPRRRPFLIFTAEETGDERRIRLVADQSAAPFERPGSAKVTVGWRGPDGIMESTTEEIETAVATPALEPGRSYPRRYPLSYPSSIPVGAVVVTNGGNVTSYPVLELYGPATDPVIANVTTGQVIAFSGLELGPGDFLELDTRERTIFLDGIPTASRYGFVDFAVSDWFGLEPGENLIRYYPDVFSVGAEAVVRYRAAWI